VLAKTPFESPRGGLKCSSTARLITGTFICHRPSMPVIIPILYSSPGMPAPSLIISFSSASSSLITRLAYTKLQLSIPFIVASRGIHPYPRRRNPSRQWSRPISVNPVLAASGACTSSRPSNAGCSRARRPTLPRQPERRRDPARPDPISRRSHAAPASDPTCVRRTWQSNRRPNRLHAGHASTSIRPNIRPLRSCRTLSRRRQRRRHDWRNLQIPIGHRIRPAGSFFGDFPTPAGVRNFSRKRSFACGRRIAASGPKSDHSLLPRKLYDPVCGLATREGRDRERPVHRIPNTPHELALRGERRKAPSIWSKVGPGAKQTINNSWQFKVINHLEHAAGTRK
jgi:hypothetical protein